jgi:hypothetical protein
MPGEATNPVVAVLDRDEQDVGTLGLDDYWKRNRAKGTNEKEEAVHGMVVQSLS